MKPTILAIDDDPIILDMYQAILDEDYNLHLASSGQEALNFLDSHPRVDLILLDIVMPEMDGYEVCRKVRENPLLSNAKVILVSSKVMLEDRLKGYEIGADDYITKPFEGSELLAKVRVFLRLKNAEEIDKIKSNFITLFHHEARTPLTVILGYAGVLLESPSLTDKEKSFVEQIIKCGQALSRSSEKTVLLSDLKSGKVRIEKQKILLNHLLAACQAKLAGEAQEKRVSFQVQIDSDLWVEGDLRLLGFAIEALLDNAVKYGREGSVVDVSGKAARERVVIEVTNDGEKISPEDQELIFNELSVRDFQHHHQGHGLSLAVARRIIEAHDGSLSLRNHDRGPTFTIEMKA